MSISSAEYFSECRSIAEEACAEAIEHSGHVSTSRRLEYACEHVQETVDGHQWIIYYHYNDDVLRHSGNEDAWEECYDSESIGDLVKDKGMDGARTVQACFAMIADVMECLDDAMEEAEESEEVKA
jgi:hypothetical protein